MLSDEEKLRIEEEEAYRAKVRSKLPPAKVEGFRDKSSRISMWIGITILLLLLGSCILTSLPK